MNVIKKHNGFTLVEMMVVLTIIGVLVSMSFFVLSGVSRGGRDTRRKGDLQQIRSGLEMFHADCGKYPASITFGGTLVGDGSSTSCAVTNTYIASIPRDPSNPTYVYTYSGSTTAYTLCVYLEQVGSGSVSGCSSCGAASCNYKETNP